MNHNIYDQLENLVNLNLNAQNVNRFRAQRINNGRRFTPKTVVNKWKAKTSERYRDSSHREYCRKNISASAKPDALKLLNVPHMTVNIALEYPTITNEYLHPKFKPEVLDLPKIPFKSNIMELKYGFTNLTIQNYIYKVKHEDSLSHFESLLDMEWIKAMNRYISDLPIRDSMTVAGYTKFGDKVINTFFSKTRTFDEPLFLRSIKDLNMWTSYFPFFFQCLDVLRDYAAKGKLPKHTVDARTLFSGTSSKSFSIPIAETPQKRTMTGEELVREIFAAKKNSYRYILLRNLMGALPMDFWKQVFRLYANDLQRIISNSPVLPKPLVVYRGVSDDYYLKGPLGRVHKPNAFISTSLNLNTALGFMRTSRCCFKRILIPKGAHVLLTAPLSQYDKEYEVLMGIDTAFYAKRDKKIVSKFPFMDCPEPTSEVILSDMWVVNYDLVPARKNGTNVSRARNVGTAKKRKLNA